MTTPEQRELYAANKRAEQAEQERDDWIGQAAMSAEAKDAAEATTRRLRKALEEALARWADLNDPAQARSINENAAWFHEAMDKARSALAGTPEGELVVHPAIPGVRGPRTAFRKSTPEGPS